MIKKGTTLHFRHFPFQPSGSLKLRSQRNHRHIQRTYLGIQPNYCDSQRQATHYSNSNRGVPPGKKSIYEVCCLGQGMGLQHSETPHPSAAWQSSWTRDSTISPHATPHRTSVVKIR